MEITLQIPDPVAESLGYTQAVLTRRASEALLVDECVRGHSRGKVAEILGLSFQAAEELFCAHGVPYPIKTSSDDLYDNVFLKRRKWNTLL